MLSREEARLVVSVAAIECHPTNGGGKPAFLTEHSFGLSSLTWLFVLIFLLPEEYRCASAILIRRFLYLGQEH